MKPIAFATLLVTLLATVAQADIGPPKGFKRLPLEHVIESEKDYPDLLFFTAGVGPARDAVPVKIDSKKPAKIVSGYRGVTLVAVPKDAAKSYPTEKDFHAAVTAGKVEGTIKSKLGFGAFIEVKDSDTRKVQVMKYKLEKIDEKDGIVVVPLKDDVKPEEEESLNQPASRSLALGLAMAGFIGFAGLVVVRWRK